MKVQPQAASDTNVVRSLNFEPIQANLNQVDPIESMYPKRTSLAA